MKYPLYSARILARRTLFENLKFVDLPISSGYAYEDWHFNCNAVALGYRYFAVEGAAVFYRQRFDSRNHDADAISVRQIPPSQLFEPRVFLRLCSGEIRQLARRRGQTIAPVARGAAVFEDPVYRDLITRANAIDPAVDLGHFSWDSEGHYNNHADSTVGVAYYRICEMVGDTQFEAVFLPFGGMPNGGADLAATAIHELILANPGSRALVLLDESSALDQASLILPPSVLVLDLAQYDILSEDRELVCLKLLEASASAAVLHFTPSPFAHRFLARFGSLLRNNLKICYRLADQMTNTHGFQFVDPTQFEFISEHIDIIDRVVVFDRETFDADRFRLPDVRNKWYFGGSVRLLADSVSEPIA